MLLLLEAYAPPVHRISGGKLIASYSFSNDGKLKEDMRALVEQEKEDEKLLAAVLAYWYQK